MRSFGWALAASASLLALAACGGGSGVAPTTTMVTTPALPIQAAASASFAGNAPLMATGATPTVSTFAVGTVIPLQQSALAVTSTTVAPANTLNSGGVTLTFTGNQTINSQSLPVFELKVPGLGIDTILSADGSATTAGGFSLAGQIQGGLVYTMPYLWQATSSGSTTNYLGLGLGGLQTPASAVPTSGQATYSVTPNSQIQPSGDVFGLMSFISNGSVVQGAILGNKASMTVNFATGAVAGSMTPSVGAPGFTGQTWNTVTFAGSLSGAALSGTTAVSTAPPGDLSFDSSSTGTFNGALFGPNGQELGAVWSLHDPTGQGKTAIGTISLPRTN